MESNKIKELSNKIKTKILNIDDYKFGTDHSDNIKLTSHVVIYNTGNFWKIVSLDVCLSYPIIHDKYVNENESYDITFALCPITLRAIYLKGNFDFLTYTDELRMVLKENETNDTLIPIDLGTKIDKKFIIQSNKRSEVKITTLRNALIVVPDALFLNTNKNINYILDKKYYSNYNDIDNLKMTGLIHPKTLVYLVQYKSNDNIKHAIILGKDINKTTATGYDSKKSEIFEYLDTHKKIIINADGFLMPILWYIAKEAYPQAKVIYVD